MSLYDSIMSDRSIVITHDILERLYINGRDWDLNLSMCCYRNGGDFAMAKYCINRGATNYMIALISATLYGGSSDIINLLIEQCSENINYHLEVACQHGYMIHSHMARKSINIVILLLKAYDKINLSSLRLVKPDENELFNIIMIKPFDINRKYFSLSDNTNVCTRLDEYNSYILTELKLVMCNDVASIVSSYSYL